MKNLWDWIVGTIRPACFFLSIPVVLGALITGTPIHWDICYAIGAAVQGSGFANAFNNVIDRKIDALNPAKNTLAVKKPIAAWYFVLFMMPPMAIVLRSNSYNQTLFGSLYYLCLVYSYTLGRVPILKRLVVAVVVALTSFLYVKEPTPALWAFAAVIFALNLFRETRKDWADRKEDWKVRFDWTKANFDKWCVFAPLVAPLAYATFLLICHKPISFAKLVLCFGMAVNVWSYVQIRYRYGWYKMKLLHQVTGGRLGVVIALVGLMPAFVNPAFLLVALFNSAMILHRSFMNKQFAYTTTAKLQDAWLWASLALMAMTDTGYQPITMTLFVTTGLFVFCWESFRIKSLKLAT